MVNFDLGATTPACLLRCGGAACEKGLLPWLWQFHMTMKMNLTIITMTMTMTMKTDMTMIITKTMTMTMNLNKTFIMTMTMDVNKTIIMTMTTPPSSPGATVWAVWGDRLVRRDLVDHLLRHDLVCFCGWCIYLATPIFSAKIKNTWANQPFFGPYSLKSQNPIELGASSLNICSTTS